MRPRRLAQLLLVIGAALMVGGVSLLSVPLALILAGVLCGAFGVLLATRLA